MAITTVCFDVGGVLLELVSSYAEACRIADIEIRGRDFAKYIGQTAFASKEYECGRITTDEFLREMSASFNHLYSPDELKSIILDSWIFGEYLGVNEIVKQLNDAGIITAALSNTNSGHWQKALTFDVMRSIIHRFASCELGVMKPDKKIYKMVEECLGQSGENIIFFDDDLQNVDVAQQCGWMAVHIQKSADRAKEINSALRQLRVLIQ